MKCPLCEYDSRGGANNYFTVTRDEQLWRCFVCNAEGNAYQLRWLLRDGHDHVAPTPPPATSKPTSSGRAVLQGASVQALALNKGLDAEWLETFLGWEDTKWYQTPSVLIRYPDEDNENPILRHRVGIDNGERFRWERFSEGQRTRPYGLWTLDWAKQKGYIVLVEGETDFATLLYNDIPALGIPGAQSWSKGWETYLAGIDQVYIWKEPDLGGVAFVEKVTATLYQGGYIIEAPPGIKDPNEMYQQAREGFEEMFLDLLQDALENPTAPSKPIATWGNDEVGITSSEDANSPDSGKCSDLRGSEQPAAFQEGIETSSPPGAKEGCQGHLAVGALP